MIRINARKSLSVLATILVATSALAQAPPPSAITAPAGEICITVDEARDTLSPQDRAAALLLVARQFELAGKHVGPVGCLIPYTLSHVRLGNTIVVALMGADGNREGTALGLDDLPALYSQMVRSMVTGRPMAGFNVVDRTNVTASQADPLRVQSDSFKYARLGYGYIFGDHGYTGPSLGFGYRAEFDSFGIDVSILNLQFKPGEGYDRANGATVGSFLKLEGLYFLNPVANASAYGGAGISYGSTIFGGSRRFTGGSSDSWSGSGLQGELTVGYEFPRASSLRMFVQADATFPFYKATLRPNASSPGQTIHRYAPMIAVSVGLGWQRNRSTRR